MTQIEYARELKRVQFWLRVFNFVTHFVEGNGGYHGLNFTVTN